MTKPKAKPAASLPNDAPAAPTSVGPRRGRIVVYETPRLAAAPSKSKKAAPAKAPSRAVLAVYHLTDRTNPGGPERVEVALEENGHGSYLVPLDAHRANIHFEGMMGAHKDIELEYLTPDGPVVIARATGVTWDDHANPCSALLHMFMWYTPKEA